MQYVFTPPPQPAVPVAGSQQLFPVHRVYCVGRNYVDHAKEMGHTGREAPFFFLKPADTLLVVPDGVTGEMPYPPLTADLHHEIELVVAIGKGGSNIPAAEANQHIWGYAIGLDMTRRDLQMKMREMGRPWEVGKAFDYSAPIGALHALAGAGELTEAGIVLEVDGAVRQKSDLRHLIWSVPEIIANLSTLFELRPGDLIFTGTPEGVGAVKPGETITARIEGLTPITVNVA
jgi:fumarylpyruvate hydrolase